MQPSTPILRNSKRSHPSVTGTQIKYISGDGRATGYLNDRTLLGGCCCVPVSCLPLSLSSPSPHCRPRASHSAMLHSIYDLTTFCRKTTGDVPAKLVGASTTVVGSKMYLFGGRLVTERRMVSDLYVFDLETFVWERIPVSPEDDIPRARYFHSADTWNNHLVVFGGMSNQPDSINPDDLCVLHDVRFFNFDTRHWLPAPPSSPESDPLLPRARYAHLSSVTADRLFIIGGQDFFNTWLDDVCVYDLPAKKWVQRRDYPRHCGTYRSVAVSSNTTVRSPQEEMQTSASSSTLGLVGSRFQANKSASSPPDDVTPPESLMHLPYSSAPTEDHPSDIYLYSNYNFTDVKRELEVFSPLPDSDFTIQDRSNAMTGTTCPPGLRFPTGAILGTHLIIAGTYLAHSYQSFSIWVLDLVAMTWSRIDPGKAIETGSWFRGCLWADANKFLIFGNRHGNLVDDYNRRLLSWDHVAVVDLEAFGIYQPPPLKLDVRMQELGLAALEERVLTDFEVVCDDGQKIACSRRILEDRWPWFKEQRKQLLKKAKSTLESLPTSSMHIPMPEVADGGLSDEPHVDPRLTARAFHLSEPFPVTLAFLQYFYSLALVTPLQHTPAVLSQLLILATNYRITHLESLVKHAMHRALSNATSVGVYEVATLCSCRSLQIRALKTVMSYTQKRPSRRTEKENGSSSRPSESTSEVTTLRGSAPSSKYVSRARGTSDAKWRSMGDSRASSSGYINNHEVPTSDQSVSELRQHASPAPASRSQPADGRATGASSQPPSDAAVHHAVQPKNRPTPTPIYTSAITANPAPTSDLSASELSDYATNTRSTTDDEGQMDDRTNGDPKDASQRIRGWSTSARTKNNSQGSISIPAPPPMAVAASMPDSVPPPLSATSSIARFLSRPIKRQQSLPADDVDDFGAANTGAPEHIKKELARIEKEKKRLRKEAKSRALQDSNGGSGRMMGMGMLGGNMAI